LIRCIDDGVSTATVLSRSPVVANRPLREVMKTGEKNDK
jgi:hypothetical protein